MSSERQFVTLFGAAVGNFYAVLTSELTELNNGCQPYTTNLGGFIGPCFRREILHIPELIAKLLSWKPFVA